MFRRWGAALLRAAAAAPRLGLTPLARDVSTQAINLKPGYLIDEGSHLYSIIHATHTQGRAGQRGNVQVCKRGGRVWVRRG